MLPRNFFLNGTLRGKITGSAAMMARGQFGELAMMSAATPQTEVTTSLGREANAPEAGAVAWRGKRSFDIAMVLAAAPVAIMLVAFAALLIKLMEGGPIFFVQERIGLNGRRFRMIKLRTMRVQSASNSKATSVGDNRITPLGAVLRGYRIDELPQLVNVLKGEMSLIGPRPELPVLVENYSRDLPAFPRRHTVKPGITGLAQVSCGYAANLRETRRKLRFDLLYVEKMSVAIDLYILILTVRTILGRTGAR
jgi:lipopolysaccharide/colanic/teichoic acid biosynthesis glycosyltransferase